MPKLTFLSFEEMLDMGFASIGADVKISRNAVITNPEDVSLGSNIRIDDFSVLYGSITLKGYNHIGGGSYLFGKHGITMEKFAGMSARCTIYTVTDNFMGKGMTGPTVPDWARRMTEKPVIMKEHIALATGVVILPGVTLEEGVAAAPQAVIKQDVPEWSVVSGNPAKVISKRKREVCLEHGRKLS